MINHRRQAVSRTESVRQEFLLAELNNHDEKTMPFGVKISL
jgi:hypothetical protein